MARANVVSIIEFNDQDLEDRPGAGSLIEDYYESLPSLQHGSMGHR